MKELITEMNWGIIMPLLIIQVALILVALIDWIRTDETNGPKWLWLVVILCISMLGPVLYFVIGRRQQ